MTLNFSSSPLQKRDLGDYGFARARDSAFDAVQKLWRRRQVQGVRQSDLAKRLGRDEGWVSRNLSGPANWTLRTLGEFVTALDGEIEIFAHALEDPPAVLSNYDAYAECHPETYTENADYLRNWRFGRWADDWKPDDLQGDGAVLVTGLKIN